MIVLGVHGIDSPEDYALGRIWTRRLRRNVTPVRWDSTTATADVWRMATDARWRWGQIWRVIHAIRMAQERSRRHVTPLAIVGHSAGAVWVHAALRHMQRIGWRIDEATYPIYIGSPITHPLLGRWLEVVGLGEHLALHLRRPVAFYNPDDPVAASRLLGARRPWYLDVREIDVTGDGFEVEHWPDPYLLHPTVHEYLYSVDGGGHEHIPIDVMVEE